MDTLAYGNGDSVKYIYNNGKPMFLKWNGTTYQYVTNVQGDVIAILDTNGKSVVEYTYDAWGNILTTTGSKASDLGVINPLRYRGYVYDQETGLYYLQSRYYDPTWGRFINADDVELLGANGDFASLNLFAYCGNNPVARADDGGNFWNFVIGGAVGALIGGATAALSSYKATGSVNWSSVALGAGIGAISGVIGASGIPALGQAAASGLLSAANNVGNSLIKGEKIDWMDVGVDAAIGAVSSLVGSYATKHSSAAAKSTIKKGINRVVSGLDRYNSGSRYWKGAMKRGMGLIAKGVTDLNFAQGAASVIGSEVAGILSVGKTIIQNF